jgi:hypothetical protein
MKFLIPLIMLLITVSTIAKAVTVPLGQVQYPVGVIAASGTTTGAISTSGASLVGCQMPATFTGATISFTVATTLAGTYQELDNSSGKVSYTVTQGKYIAINPVDFYGVQFFKIVSASTEGSSRSLACSLKGI